MIILLILYLILFMVEWAYLKRHHRKVRTFIIVLAVMSVSMLYNISIISFEHVSNPNLIIEAIFR